MPSFSDPLWVITSYYNPANYRSRLSNFQAFRRYLNAPLLVIELARPGHHQLTKEDGEIVIDLVGDDRIWQKERMLNIALDELPPHVEFVAWIDCDVVFEDDGWALKARQRLSKRCGLLQLFGTAAHLPRTVDMRTLSPAVCAQYTPITTSVSIVGALTSPTSTAHQTAIEAKLYADHLGQYRLADQAIATGMAWAATRAALAPSGFYDRNIIGGGDSVLLFASRGRLDEYFAFRRLTLAHQNDVRLWAEQARSSALFSTIDALDHTLYHLWHGDLEDRNYRGRYDVLYRHGFDPTRDIRHSPDRTWMWTNPESLLAEEVADYFFSRQEDSLL